MGACGKVGRGEEGDVELEEARSDNGCYVAGECYVSGEGGAVDGVGGAGDAVDVNGAEGADNGDERACAWRAM